MAGRPLDVARSPADVLRLLVAVTCLLALLLVEALFGSAVVGFAADLFVGVSAIDETLLAVLVSVVRIATVGALVVGFAASLVTGRARALLTAVVGAGAGVLLVQIAEAVIDPHRPPIADIVASTDVIGGGTFPTTVGVTIAAAAVTAAAPWASRTNRRIGWALVIALMLALLVTAPLSGIAVAAVVCGWTGGALALVVLGSPARRPTVEAVIGGLRGVGLDVAELTAAAVDARGSTPYFGKTDDGRRLFVKVLCRDERSADLLFRLYRWVLPRDLGDGRPFGSLRQAVEHEALVALMASSVGVRTPAVLAVADAEPGGVVLAYEAVDGKSLDRVEPADLTDEVLRAVWSQLAILRHHRIAHRDLRLANLFLSADGSALLIDFGFAELAASDVLLATDLAELLSSLALSVGAARAVASGGDALGRDSLETAQQRLAPGYLSGATRTGLKANPGLLAAVESELVALPS